MADLSTRPVRTGASEVPVYAPLARALHWLTVMFLLVQIPVGFYMAYRGNVLNVWDGLTNTLYSAHKLLGLVILLVVIWRIAYRVTKGSPPDEPSIETWQSEASHANHWWLYLLLLVMPLLGWLGVSYYPALDVFGFKLPALFVAPDQDMAARAFFAHALGAFLLVLLIGVHVSAALYHYFIRKDGVLTRMLPSRRPR